MILTKDPVEQEESVAGCSHSTSEREYVYGCSVMLADDSNLERSRALLLLVARAVFASRGHPEVFVNCLEAAPDV